MQLLQSIKKYAEIHPDSIAFVNGSESLTYGNLWRLSDGLAAYLQKQHLEKSEPIIVYGHMEPEMIISFLGCVKAGHPYIPVDTSVPMERIMKIIESSHAAMIINVSKQPLELGIESIKSLNGNQIRTLFVDKTYTDSQHWVKENDNFYIIYTSGSTGDPKGVQISAKNLQSFVDWILDDFPIKQGQRFLNQAPFSFDLSVMDLYPCLSSGGTLFAVTKEMIAKPKLVFDAFRNYNVQIWTSTPSFVQMCLMDPAFSIELLPELEVFLFCGEILPNKTVRQLKQRFPDASVFNSYGPTEATVAITGLKVTEEIVNQFPALPVGTCKKDSRLLIVDEDGEEVPDQQEGEIIIVGPSVSKGYLGKANLTEKSFFLYDGEMAYRTGDVGFIKGNQLFYKGRIDYQIKLHGYRMEIEEIEHHLTKSKYVKRAVITPIYKSDENVVDYLLTTLVPEEHHFEREYQLTEAIKKELKLVRL